MKNWKKLEELIDRNTLDEYVREQYKESYGREYEVDIYAYINDEEEEMEVTFETFTNVGGNSWLNDDHFTIYRFKPSYQTLADEFESNKEFVEYMIDCYNVEVPFDEFTCDDGEIDYCDCAKYIMGNFKDEYDKAVSDLIDESWNGTITDAIVDSIHAKAEEEELC